MPNTILLDLDGTIADSFCGIANSILYSLDKLGIDAPPRESLRSFVGPPLLDEFKRRFGLNDETAREAVRLYREYYPQKGIYEQTMIADTVELLTALKTEGYRICLATSKPHEYAEKILGYFKIENYFDEVFGATMDGKISDKAQIIRLALEGTGAAPDECVMVGDRFHDVDGAHKCGVKCIGVLSGYGSRKELEDCGADFIAERLSDIPRILRIM